jgi:hypothetical protein
MKKKEKLVSFAKNNLSKVKGNDALSSNVSNTYKLHKSITEYPSIMCSYYNAGAINRLLKNQYI